MHLLYSYKGYIYIFIHVHACREPLLAVPAAWWSGSVLGGVVVLLSLRESVGEEGPIWGQFGTSAKMFPSNRRQKQAQLPSSVQLISLMPLEEEARVPANSQEPGMSEICASQELLEYRHPDLYPATIPFKSQNPPESSLTLSLKIKLGLQM